MRLGNGIPTCAFELIQEPAGHHASDPSPRDNEEQSSPRLCSICRPCSNKKQSIRKVIREHRREVDGPLTDASPASFEHRKQYTDTKCRSHFGSHVDT